MKVIHIYINVLSYWAALLCEINYKTVNFRLTAVNISLTLIFNNIKYFILRRKTFPHVIHNKS
jgi:hypothetical protein